MKKALIAVAAGLLAALAAPAQAYSIKDLRDDCEAAEELFAQKKPAGPAEPSPGDRCISYVVGFADGYAISDYLAEKVGIRLNGFCLQNDEDRPARLVRAVLTQLHPLPPNSQGSTAMAVAGALSRAFPCGDSLESRK